MILLTTELISMRSSQTAERSQEYSTNTNTVIGVFADDGRETSLLCMGRMETGWVSTRLVVDDDLNCPSDLSIGELRCLNQEGEIVVRLKNFLGRPELGEDLCCLVFAAQRGQQLGLMLHDEEVVNSRCMPFASS